MIFSYSRLKKYEECPRAFYQKYILELPEEPTEALELGKAVHQVIQEVLTGSSEPMEEIVRRACSEAALPIDPEEVRQLATHRTVTEIKDIAVSCGHVEEHFELPLDGPGSPILQGYIDLWWEDPAEAVLMDWKTNRAVYNPKDNHQLGIYAWAINQITRREKIAGYLAFLRFSPLENPNWEIYGPKEMEAARQWALSLAKDIEARLAELELFGGNPQELFPAKPGDACRWCTWKAECLNQAGTAGPVSVPETVGSTDEAKALAAEIIRLEGVLEEMKKQLKEWVQTNGPVRVGDQEFRLTPSVSWTFPPEKLKELCAALHQSGLNPWEYLTIGSSQLKKLKWTEEELARFGEKKETNSFRRVKAKSA